MPALPSSLALTSIATGADILSADHRNNYAAIQAAVNGIIAALGVTAKGSLLAASASGTLTEVVVGSNGQALVADSAQAAGVKWQATTKITTSALSGGPPASPADTDIWIATGVESTYNGRWVFQYDSAEASANKWKFLGGEEVIARNDAGGSTASTSYVTVTNTPTLSIARAGDYAVKWRFRHGGASVGQGMYCSPDGAGLTASDAMAAQPVDNTGASTYHAARDLPLALTAGTLSLKCRVSGGSAAPFDKFTVAVVPIRIA